MNEQIFKTEESFKRYVGFKVKIGNIFSGKANFEGERLNGIEINGKTARRVNIIANIVDKYIQDGEKKYGAITLDDATGQIKCKLFGEDINKFSPFEQGDTVFVLGLLRSWKNEIYIIPEIIKKRDPKYLLIRKLEIDNETPNLNREQVTELKNIIVKMIKEGESAGGADIDKIILELKEPPEIINQEIKKLLEEGTIYEPRPGKLRYLG